MRVLNLGGRLHLESDGGAVDVEAASTGQFSPDPQAIYERWDEFGAWAERQRPTSVAPFDTRDLGPPAPHPRQVFAIGLNYRGHATESGFAIPTSPVLFTKFPSCLAGGEVEVVTPDGNVDWEVELVAVIGRRAKDVPTERGWQYVAGLTVGQDLSERVAQHRGSRPQFSLAKSFRNFGPMGPRLVTPDELDDPNDVVIGCRLNGEEMQRARTSDLIFGVAISSLSSLQWSLCYP